MNYPLSIQFKDMEVSDFISRDIRVHAERLEHFFNRIISGHVVISAPHRHKSKGKQFYVQIRLRVPGKEIFVKTHAEQSPPREDIYTAIHRAFAAVKRQLEDVARRMRGAVKQKSGALHGKILRFFPEEGYGFIHTPDAREIYFHRNSVVRGFSSLQVGDEVRFSEALGELGPQVTSMSRIGKKRA